jgi:molybdopterin molybdotransferase
MITYEDALERVLKPLAPVSVVSMSLTEALGCFLADAVTARVDMPGFDTASMDGYAVRAEEVVEAGVCLPCGFEVAAGRVADRPLQSGETARILTGAPMPAGADAVAMQEDTEREADGRIHFLDGVKPWENVRFRGEDFRMGTRVMAVGQRLGATQLALVAAAGHAEVRVHRRVRVVVMGSGDELRSPGSPLKPGEVHDSNSVLLGSMFRSAGAEVEVLPVLPDRLEATMVGLESAVSRGDLVVTAGGASVGDRDFLRPAWERLGGQLEFFRVAIKPGKPLFFGSLRGVPLIGLPGNPVSTFVTAVLIALPALRRLQGSARVGLPVTLGTLSAPLSNPGDRRHFMRVILDEDGRVRSAGVQASHILGPLAQANGLVDVPPATEWPAGTPVRVLRWSQD